MRTGLEEELTARTPARRFTRPSAPPPSSPVDVEEQVTELQALRERLLHDLAVMEERVDALARVRDARPRGAVEDDRAAALQAKLRETAAALEASRQMRLAIADHIVARDHERVVEAATQEAMTRRTRTRGRALFAVAGLVAGGAAGAFAAAGVAGDDPSPAPAPPRPAAAAPAPPSAIASCGDIGAGAGANGTVWCTTGKTLAQAAGTKPLVMGDTEARVLRLARAGDQLTVRARVRNDTGRSQELSRRLYLSIGGRRIFPSGPVPAVAAKTASTVSLRFAVGPTSSPRADLGVLPFGQPADADAAKRIGAIHLELPRG